VRGPEARSAQIDRPAGVIRVIQVRLNKVEPSESVNGRNLFAKANDRSSCFDEWKPDWPKMPFVVERLALAGRTEGLTGTGTGPDLSVIWPSRKSQGIAPDSDPGEEVTLGISSEVVSPNIGNWSLIHVSRSDQIAND
jgi:hypothetical protein